MGLGIRRPGTEHVASPAVTLAVHGRIFRNTDEGAADAIGTILSAAGVE